MKTKNLLTILLMMLFCTTQAWGTEGDVFYTLTCSQNSSNTAYGSNYDVTIPASTGLTWNAPGNQNFSGYWRIGGKSLTSATDRTITGKSAIGQVIGKVTLNHKGKSNNSLTINSIQLVVASDALFTNVIETITKSSPSISVSTDGSIDFEPTGDDWPKNSYYKLIITVTNSVGSNYGLDVASLVFYEGNTGPACTDPTTPLSITSANTLEVGQQLTLTTTGGNGEAIVWTLTGGSTFTSLSGNVLTATGGTGTATVKATQAKDETNNICGASISQNITVANAFVDVIWTVNGTQVKTEKVETGSKVTSVPDAPSKSGDKVFVGWTSDASVSGSKPTVLFTEADKSPEIAGATEYKAVFAEEGVSETEYVQYSGEASKLPIGQKILIVNSGYALSNEAGGSTLKRYSVTISSSKINNPADKIKWTVGDGENGKYTLMSGSNYLSSGSNQLFCNSTKDTWTVTVSSTAGRYYFDPTNNNTKRLEYYSSNSCFSAYTANTTDIFKMYIYVQGTAYTNYTTEAGEKVATPVITPEQTTFGSAFDVTITCATAGAAIYYTLDGSTPTSSSTLYEEPFPLTESKTVKAIAIKNGCPNSDVATKSYTIDPSLVTATPVISPATGSHFKGGSQTVTITCSEDGATIYYTTDESTPVIGSPSTEYTGSFPISATTTIKAIAQVGGKSASAVATSVIERYYDATFYMDGDEYNAVAELATEGANITMPAAPSRACNGYTFVGWANAKKEGTASAMTYAPDEEVAINKNTSFYAVYQKAADSKYYTGFTCLTPTLDAPSALAIGKSKIDKTRMVSINLTGSNIIGTTTLAISGDDAAKFVVSPASIDAPDGGSLSQAVTISYTPTEKKTDAATLTISSTDAAPIEVALSGEGANMSFRRFLTKCKPTVFFDVLNVHEHYAEIDNEGHVPAYTPTGTCSGKEFIGWSLTQINEVQQEQPALVDLSTYTFDTSDPTAGINLYAVFASPNGGKVGALDSVTDVFTSYAAVSYFQNSEPRVYGRWNVLGGGPTNIKDVTDKMGKQAIVLQKQAGDAKATMTANIKGFMGLNAYIATTDNSVYYTISYSTDGGTNWTDLVGSTNHNGIRTKLLKQPTKLAEPVDALVKFELTSASSSGSSYRIYVDDVKIYTKPRTYWYSDFSTNCEKGEGESASMTFDVNGGTGEIAVISTPGVDVTLPDASSTSLECYTLAGWKVDGKESPEEGEDIYMFAPGDKYLLNHSVTMVAQWEKDLTTPAATLIFHKGYNNTEEVVVNCHSTAGEIEAIRPECAAGDGFEFVGWTRTPLPAEGQVEKPELFNIAKEITTISAETINLYPVWNGGVLTGTDYTAGATGNYVIAAEVSTGNWVAIPNAPVINEKGKISGETIKVGTTDGGVKYVLEGDAEGYIWTISNNDSKGQRFFDGEWYIYPTGGGSNTSSNISRGKTGDAVSNYGWTVSHNTYWEIASTDGTTDPATVNMKGLIYRTTDGYGFGQYTVGSVSATYKEVRILPIYRRDGKYMPTPDCRSVINAEESSKGLVSKNGVTIKSNGRLIITKMYGPAIAGEITGADAGKFAVTFGEKYTESEIEYIPYTVAYTPTAVGERATATITFDDGSGNTWTAESEGAHPSITVRGMAVPETFVIAAKVGEEYIALPENTSGSAGAVSGTTIQVGMVGGQLSAFKVADALHYTMTEVASEIYQHLSSHTAAFYGNASGLRSASGATATFYDWVITLNENGTVRMKANQGGTNPVTYNSTSGKFATTVDESTAGANYYRDLYLLPILNYMDMQASVVEWFPTKVLVELANGDIWTAMKDASATSQTRFGEGAWGSAAAVDYATYGTRMCVFNTGDLTIHSGENLSVKMTVNETDYQMNVVVPIIISGGNHSVTGEPFTGLTPAVYNNMDLVIRDDAHLNADGTLAQNTFHNVTIYPNSKLRIDYGKAFQANGQITLRGGKDEIYDGSKYEMTSYGAEPQLYAMGALHHPNQAIIYYEKRVDTKRMYQLSLPANVPLANVTYGDGTPMAINTQLWAETWDGQAAANEDASEHWILEKDFDPAQFTMGVGYTVSCKRQVKGQTYSIMRFPMTKHESGKSEAEFQEYVNVTLWQKQEGTGRLNSYGWNYIGNPYMTAIEGRIYIDNEEEEETEDLEYITYMSPDGSMYYSGEASTTRMLPFRSYFVQVPCNGKLVFATNARQPNAPARKQTLEDLVKFYLALQQGATSDSACMRISESYSDSYVIGQDLEKMSIGPNTSVYYIDKNGNLAFDAVKPAHATNWIPVGFYAPSKGNMTFSLNVKEGTMNLKHVYLQDAVTKAQTDLLTDDYVFTTDQTGKIDNRFYIAVEFTQEVPTGIDDVDGTRAPFKFMYEDKLFIEYKGRIYDANGKRVKL